ncbi:MAG: prephenate dehydratase [Lachnospiraceae bacterium]|nr:prephenate dehydratase [Lachnospiraceae bacterium]
MKDLKELREEIDKIDSQMVALYEKRMEVAAGVAEYKLANGKKVFDREREKIKIAAVKSLLEKPENEQGIQELYEQLMSMSRKLQYKMLMESEAAKDGELRLPFIPLDEINKKARVVFQGAAGSYSEAAMREFFGENANSFHVETFRDAMMALEEGSAEYAVLPIENSTAGIVSEIYDLLAEFEHFIVAEQVIKIEHCLMGCPGTTLDTIETVYSHPQSLMQSEHFLREHGSWNQISMKNNAFAAEKVATEQKCNQAAIAGEYAAKVYGLEIIKKGVNHSDSNSTRFIIVSNRKVFLRDAKKISLCFEIPHESGSLYRILSHFIFNGLNMNKIESRPIEGRNWEYRFFVDFEGNLADSGVRNALCGLREEAINLRVLGNY